GTIYAKSAPVTESGSSATAVSLTSQVVVSTLTFSGTAVVNVVYSPAGTSPYGQSSVAGPPSIGE
ncbi:MAG TPA: hypothetical protein VK821_19660, partial [Dehalococcoidia bacterium]|nr:hypothetical protein [Dehalococcoidia bacterium]